MVNHIRLGLLSKDNSLTQEKIILAKAGIFYNLNKG